MIRVPYYARAPFTTRAGDFEQYRAILRAVYIAAGGGPMVDLGCGEAHVTKEFFGTYVDLVQRPTSPPGMVVCDIRMAPDIVPEKSYNLMVMSDVIEHLEATDALVLIRRMWTRCKAQFIFTPIGPYLMTPENAAPDSHKSAWHPDQFLDDGWQVLAFPAYHRFEATILGAFFAWKFRDEPTRSVEGILQLANLNLTDFLIP